MMQQYRDAKARHPGMILLFRMGDFYETFEDDAELLSRVLGLTLTSRDKTIPMAGFPSFARIASSQTPPIGTPRRRLRSGRGRRSGQGARQREVTRRHAGHDHRGRTLDPRRPNHLARSIRRREPGAGLG